MEYRPRQLNVAKMPRTLRHTLSASLTLEVPIDRTQTRIHQPSDLGLVCGFIHHFREFDLRDRVGFLWNTGGEPG